MAKFFISFLLLFLGSQLALAQERVIDEATYRQEMKSAGEYRLSENYRVRKTTVATSGPMTLEIHEVQLPGPKMRIRMFRIDRKETEPSSEWIHIGEKVYVRRQGLAWQEEQPRAPVPITKAEVTKVEYRDLGNDPQSSMPIFQKTVQTQMSLGGELIENTQIVKSWIDRTGRLRKEEYTSTNPKTGSTILTMDYEVDPTIRIEAPIK